MGFIQRQTDRQTDQTVCYACLSLSVRLWRLKRARAPARSSLQQQQQPAPREEYLTLSDFDWKAVLKSLPAGPIPMDLSLWTYPYGLSLWTYPCGP